MASILKVDTLQKPDGSTPTAADLGIDVASGDMPSGSVVQVAHDWSTTNASFSSGVWTQVPNLEVTITPTSASNTVLVDINLPNFYTAGTSDCLIQIRRNGTAILPNNTNVYAGYSSYSIFSYFSGRQVVSQKFMDTPATTASCTYTVYIYSIHASGQINYPNPFGHQTITASEIAQ